MKPTEAKILYEAHALSSASIYKAKGGEGWILKFETISPVEFLLELETEKSGLRVFKSTDAAIQAAEKIGFDQVTVLIKLS
jgi:hypothetical protein